MSLSDAQELILIRTERVASAISLLCCLFVVLTFTFSARFRKPVNRLIFYAVWGNIFFNVATLISVSGVWAGKSSTLCQIQGFLVQAFLPADAMWNLSMAINVYLTVFKSFEASQLRAKEPYYFLINYGSCFVVALIYCFVSSPDKGKVYGPAILWCWVANEREYLRIVTCYGPAWVCIVASFTIYVLAGRQIFHKRQQLRRFNISPGAHSITPGAAPHDDRFSSYKMTEVQVTSEAADLNTRPLRESFNLGMGDRPRPNAYDQYSVTIGGGSYRIASSSLPPTFSTSPPSPTFPKTSGSLPQANRQRNAAMEANTASWAYTKCCILFFMSLLVTWVPSSINRVWSLANPDAPESFSLNYTSGLVLPLTGFWNSLIYVVTSWRACKSLYNEDIAPLFRRMRRRTSSWSSRTLPRSDNYMGRLRTLSSSTRSTDKATDVEILPPNRTIDMVRVVRSEKSGGAPTLDV